MACKPCVFISSCCNLQPKDIASEILESPNPEARNVIEHIYAFPWHIDTKYYTADIEICISDIRTIGSAEFAASVEGFVLLCDFKEPDSLEKLTSWLPFIKELSPEVKILACDKSLTTDHLPRHEVIQWCLERGFELVELNAEVEESEFEDDFGETTGVRRITQALHAHSWPNLVLKERPNYRSELIEKLMLEEAEERRQREHGESESCGDASLTESAHPADKTQQAADSKRTSNCDTPKDCTLGFENDFMPFQQAPQNPSSLPSDEPVSDLTSLSGGVDEPGVESFEQLFEQMRVLKDRADAMPPEQRRAYADKVTLSFWRAIGGDENEVAGLSSDEEDYKS